jgi:hypothetical protein
MPLIIHIERKRTPKIAKELCGIMPLKQGQKTLPPGQNLLPDWPDTYISPPPCISLTLDIKGYIKLSM